MSKKRKIDFVLYEDDYETVIFRFYPRQSHCHGFHDFPPTHRGEIYKVYYSYSVFSRWTDDSSVETLFSCSCDECSVIDEVAARIKLIVDGNKSVTNVFDDEEYTIELLNNEMRPFGCGVSWTIDERNEDLYRIMIWNYDNTGYRFYLHKDKLKEFGEYLNECCEYMLAHGEPI